MKLDTLKGVRHELNKHEFFAVDAEFIELVEYIVRILDVLIKEQEEP